MDPDPDFPERIRTQEKKSDQDPDKKDQDPKKNQSPGGQKTKIIPNMLII